MIFVQDLKVNFGDFIKITIIDDGSTDGSTKFLRESQVAEGEIVYLNKNKGITYIEKNLYSESKCLQVIGLPADLRFQKNQIVGFIKYLIESEPNNIHVATSEEDGRGIIRTSASKMVNILVLIFGLFRFKSFNMSLVSLSPEYFKLIPFCNFTWASTIFYRSVIHSEWDKVKFYNIGKSQEAGSNVEISLGLVKRIPSIVIPLITFPILIRIRCCVRDRKSHKGKYSE